MRLVVTTSTVGVAELGLVGGEEFQVLMKSLAVRIREKGSRGFGDKARA